MPKMSVICNLLKLTGINHIEDRCRIPLSQVSHDGLAASSVSQQQFWNQWSLACGCQVLASIKLHLVCSKLLPGFRWKFHVTLEVLGDAVAHRNYRHHI